MTQQIPDRLIYQATAYQILSVSGEGLTRPADLGLKPIMLSTACVRGYQADYTYEAGRLILTGLTVRTLDGHYAPIDGVAPDVDTTRGRATYTGLQVQTAFSGGLLIAEGREIATRGWIMPHHFATVKELLFEEGHLRSEIDHAAEMARIRGALAQDLAPDVGDTAWGFSRTYDMHHYWHHAEGSQGA
jgi:hypothetical protein